ncbi:MAG: hypothetical protein FWD66_05175 [Paludibacter sp.]|nr:hypothetical protein [Paludibacter sp.]
MKKLAGLILLTTFSLITFAQGQPNWMDENFRSTNFPKTEYFTGFAKNSVENAQTAQKVTDATKLQAQENLTQEIRLEISSTTQSSLSSQTVNDKYDEQESFENKAFTQTNAEITGLKSQTWYDSTTKMVYAFVYASKSDLTAYYQKQIDNSLSSVEVDLKNIEQMIAAGKKMSARRQCETAKMTLGGISYYMDLLSAIDAKNANFQTKNYSDLQQTVNQMLIDLEQSTFVFVDCKYEFKGNENDAFDQDPAILCDIVKQALSENECSMVQTPDEADYELMLIASTTQRSDGAIISYYANVKGTLFNRLTKKKTVDFSILNDPAAYAVGKTPEIAATKAFKLPALKNKILEKILPKIKN